jgi:hypothetical protein
MKTTMIVALISGALALVATSQGSTPRAEDSRIRLSTGIEYSSGRYGGQEDIEELYVPLIFNLDTRRIGVSVSVPFLSVRAPTGTVVDGQAVPGEGDIATESGLGDITAVLSMYDVYYSAPSRVALDITGAVKFGTASYDEGLGTGEADYSLYLDAYRWFDAFTLMGSVGYRWRGDPAGSGLDNVVMASLGGSWAAGKSTRLGMYFDYRESALSGYDNVQELTVIGSTKLGENWYLQLYGFSGFTDSSPDWGGGFMITADVRRFPNRNNF